MTIFDQAKAAMMTDVRLPPPGRSLTARLVDDVMEGLRLLNTRYGLDVAEDVLADRARNIVAGLIGNYRIEDHEVSGHASHNPRSER